MREPELGEMVHFRYGGKYVAAIITNPALVIPYIDSSPVSDYTKWSVQQELTVFPPGQPPFTTVAPLDYGITEGTWNWPPDESNDL